MEKQYLNGANFYAANTKTGYALKGSLKGSFKVGGRIVAHNVAGYSWPLTASAIIKKVPDLTGFEVVDFDDLKDKADKAEFEARFYGFGLYFGGRYAALI